MPLLFSAQATHRRAPAGCARSVVALLAALTCLHAQAQSQVQSETPTTLPTLGEVSVSGSRHEQLSDDLPLSIDVIGADALSDGQARNLRDAVEAGVSDGWYKYVGLNGAVIGLDRFGESAPAELLFKEFGFTVDHVVEVVKNVLSA